MGFNERDYQDDFVEVLTQYGWEAPDYLNGNIQRVTVNDLINHWRKNLNQMNADQLEGVELTDREFQQVINKVNAISNSYEAAKLLSMEDSSGRIDGIYRDPNPNVTRSQITLTIFKKADVTGGDSNYRVAREVWVNADNRLDIVLLINGLPLINIEQKRADINLREAFHQFKRYYADGVFTNNFMVFSQMMVINSPLETKYFATPKSLGDFNESFLFNWADYNNRPINDWEKVIETFLRIPMAHQMVGDYLVIDESRYVENQRHMLLRPYQVYALQSIEFAAFGTDNEARIPHGGYIWHTTGSGKTITSFKTALFLSTRVGFDKVIFLVDRRELDQRTTENFNAYSVYEPIEVSGTETTAQLRQSLLSQSRGIVVTTTFKLHSLVKEMVNGEDSRLSKRKFVFIIDEAHRTTMGNMMVDITRYFKMNGLFFGFTGTPLYDENNVRGKINEDNQEINTTEKLFGPELHKYTIDQAIADKNVLGFHIDYINTGEFVDYRSLRNLYLEKLIRLHPDESRRNLERRSREISEADLEREELFIYQDETHIPAVVSEILQNWQSQSRDKIFNAILTVAYKNRVVKYYNEFKKQMQESGIHINVAMTVSFGSENQQDSLSDDYIQSIFDDYAKFTNVQFISGDGRRGENAYFSDLVNRTTRGGSGRTKSNIDLVIVADQLLTGYDSKFLNTLYVDRSLELHGLIQAYSRTNRVYGPQKEFGTIVNFQYPAITREAVNEALILYGSGGSSSKVIKDTYASAILVLGGLIPAMIEALPNPSHWQDLTYDIKALEAFLEAFRSVNAQMTTVMQYYEYKWDDNAFGITQETWLKYIGAYKNLMQNTGGDAAIVDIIELPGQTELADSQRVTPEFIFSLIGNVSRTRDGFVDVDQESVRLIYEKIQELSVLGEYKRAELLREFVELELLQGKVASESSLVESFNVWLNNRRNTLIREFAIDWGVNLDILEESIELYDINNPSQVELLDELVNSIDFNKARKKVGDTRLGHVISFTDAVVQFSKDLTIIPK